VLGAGLPDDGWATMAPSAAFLRSELARVFSLMVKAREDGDTQFADLLAEAGAKLLIEIADAEAAEQQQEPVVHRPLSSPTRTRTTKQTSDRRVPRISAVTRYRRAQGTHQGAPVSECGIGQRKPEKQQAKYAEVEPAAAPAVVNF
jgi:hypothetical protein